MKMAEQKENAKESEPFMSRVSSKYPSLGIAIACGFVQSLSFDLAVACVAITPPLELC